MKCRKRLAEGVCDKYKTPENDRRRLRNWRRNNPDKVKAQYDRDKTKNARAAKRRAAKRNQTPNLTEQDKTDIIMLYQQAKEVSASTGIPHEVDHIQPISRGGLHHPINLQILTRDENRQKGSNHW